MAIPSLSNKNFVLPNYPKTTNTGTPQAASTTSGIKTPTDSLSLSSVPNNANTVSELKSFLGKVLNGTVTDDDLKKMQSVLKAAPQDTLSDIASKVGFKGPESDLKIFLAQVGNGTVTQEELKKMQALSKEQPINSNIDNHDAVTNTAPNISIS